MAFTKSNLITEDDFTFLPGATVGVFYCDKEEHYILTHLDSGEQWNDISWKSKDSAIDYYLRLSPIK